MKPVRFDAIRASDGESARWLRWMDAEAFPDDHPFEFQMVNWFIGWDGKTGAAYCGWKAVMHGTKMVGFQYRAAVMSSYRGRKLQGKMLALRERDMKKQGIAEAVSYTSASNAASMRSLIASGYRPYVATDATNLAGEYKTKFVHWRKEL